MNSAKKGYCPKCKSQDVDLTTDHVIPKWLFKRAFVLFFWKDDCRKIKKRFGKRNKEIVCLECNRQKGGLIDYSIPLVRELMKEIADHIYSELKKYEGGEK